MLLGTQVANLLTDAMLDAKEFGLQPIIFQVILRRRTSLPGGTSPQWITERKLPVDRLPLLGEFSHDLDTISFSEQRPPIYLFHLTITPEKGTIHTSVIDDPPAITVAFDRTVHLAGNQLLGIRFECNIVVQLKAPDRHAILCQFDGELFLIRPANLEEWE